MVFSGSFLWPEPEDWQNVASATRLFSASCSPVHFHQWHWKVSVKSEVYQAPARPDVDKSLLISLLGKRQLAKSKLWLLRANIFFPLCCCSTIRKWHSQVSQDYSSTNGRNHMRVRWVALRYWWNKINWPFSVSYLGPFRRCNWVQ